MRLPGMRASLCLIDFVLSPRTACLAFRASYTLTVCVRIIIIGCYITIYNNNDDDDVCFLRKEKEIVIIAPVYLCLP